MIPEKILRVTIDERTEKIVQDCNVVIHQLSKVLNVPVTIVERQFRLHLPYYYRDSLFPSVDQEIFSVIRRQLENHYLMMRSHQEKCGLGDLSAQIRGNKIVSSNGKEAYSFQVVDQLIGEYIEKNLHYLAKPKLNAYRRYGLFRDNFQWPFVQFTFNKCHRAEKALALSRYLQKDVRAHEILELSRVYSVNQAPKNAISKLFSYCVNEPEFGDFKYIVSAINPFLGFRGSSLLACGFIPFAFAPVYYYYDHNGSYVGRLDDIETFTNPQFNAPPNVLFYHPLISEVVEGNLMSFIPKHDKDKIKPEFLEEIRIRLESAWNDLTKYHGTPIKAGDPISKGQCGVTTAFLAKEFTAIGYNVLFCEGNVHFPNNDFDIVDHCWLKIILSEDYDSIDNLIVDLTADQNGYENSVICKDLKELEFEGIRYIVQKSANPKEIKNTDLLARLEILNRGLT